MTQPAEASAGSPVSRDYFSLFELERTPDLSADSLEQRKRVLLANFHPDRFSDAPAAERRMAESLAAEINAAFSTLIDPVRRAGYLLTLAAVDLRAAERIPVSPEFLMHQLELREAVSEWTALSAAAQQSVLSDAATLFGQQWSDFVAAWQAEDITVATDAWVRLQYVDKLQREISERKQD